MIIRRIYNALAGRRNCSSKSDMNYGEAIGFIKDLLSKKQISGWMKFEHFLKREFIPLDEETTTYEAYNVLRHFSLPPNINLDQYNVYFEADRESYSGNGREKHYLRAVLSYSEKRPKKRTGSLKRRKIAKRVSLELLLEN